MIMQGFETREAAIAAGGEPCECGFCVRKTRAIMVVHTETMEWGPVYTYLWPIVQWEFKPKGKAPLIPQGEPQYTSKKDAYAAEGEIYQHYKGGVYRLVARDVFHQKTRERHVLYEHLFPHGHTFFLRPQEMFFEDLSNGTPRFARIK